MSDLLDQTFLKFSNKNKKYNNVYSTTNNLFKNENFHEIMFNDLQSNRSIYKVPYLNSGEDVISVDSPIILQNIPLYNIGNIEIPLQPFRHIEFTKSYQLQSSPEAFELPLPPPEFLNKISFNYGFLNKSFNLVDQLVNQNIEQSDTQLEIFHNYLNTPQSNKSNESIPFFDSLISEHFIDLNEFSYNCNISLKKTKEEYYSYITKLANYYRHLIRFDIVSKSSKGIYQNNFKIECKHFFDVNLFNDDNKCKNGFIPCIIQNYIQIKNPSNYGSPQELIISLFEELTKEGSDLEGLFYKYVKSDRCEIYLDWSPLKNNSLIIRSKFLNYQTQKAILKNNYGIGFNKKITKLSILIIKELTSNYLDIIKKEILAKNFISKKKIYKYNLYTYWYNFQITGIGTPDGVCRAMLDELVKQCNLGDSLKYKLTNIKKKKIVEFTWCNI
jgi:hypothetical protein